MASYGYARVSTAEQNLASQEQQLREHGCAIVFGDTISGAKADRPGLTSLLHQIRKDDVVVVSRLDRLGRSVQDLIGLVEALQSKGAHLKSLAEAIDTTTATGRLIFHIFASIAEFERHLIRERTMLGLAAARAQGRLSGRPEKITKEQIARAMSWAQDKLMTHTEIARALNIDDSTWRRIRARWKDPALDKRP